jgi:hypothetical protein
VRLFGRAVSAVQLGLGPLGLRKAPRHGTEYDLGFMRGSPATLKRDLWFMGTICRRLRGCSSPRRWQRSYLMTSHRSSPAKDARILGEMMTLGYVAERSIRQAWRHLNRSITALTVVAELLAVSMARRGLRRQLR